MWGYDIYDIYTVHFKTDGDERDIFTGTDCIKSKNHKNIFTGIRNIRILDDFY